MSFFCIVSCLIFFFRIHNENDSSMKLEKRSLVFQGCMTLTLVFSFMRSPLYFLFGQKFCDKVLKNRPSHFTRPPKMYNVFCERVLLKQVFLIYLSVLRLTGSFHNPDFNRQVSPNNELDIQG